VTDNLAVNRQSGASPVKRAKTIRPAKMIPENDYKAALPEAQSCYQTGGKLGHVKEGKSGPVQKPAEG